MIQQTALQSTSNLPLSSLPYQCWPRQVSVDQLNVNADQNLDSVVLCYVRYDAVGYTIAHMEFVISVLFVATLTLTPATSAWLLTQQASHLAKSVQFDWINLNLVDSILTWIKPHPDWTQVVHPNWTQILYAVKFDHILIEPQLVGRAESIGWRWCVDPKSSPMSRNKIRI